MSEERKTKTDAAAPASAALERIDRKDAFLQALHTFLTAHQGTEWAVAAVDIQHFKLYNELYGTEKGDVLLETMANCLLGYSKQTGYPVGYFGNDDFFLCLPDEKAEQTAVLATLQACMAAGRQDVTFFVVMGVCPVQANPGADAATLCNYAQIAGVTTDSGYLHRFEPTMLNELKEQQLLLGELERALDNHEFCFFLQPKCNSITRAIVGMEALVRWNHPTRGCVPPAEFMPLLERTGLVTRLDQYIWESVCQTLQKWQESGSNLVPVLAANRIGLETVEPCEANGGQKSALRFYGSSFIADETGALVADGTRDTEQVLTATFDLDKVEENRMSWGVFRDRRPEWYGEITRQGRGV